MSVVFLAANLTRYRVPFHEGVRQQLAASGIDYQLVHGQPSADEAARRDTGSLPWARLVNTHHLGFAGRTLVWQPILDVMSRAEMIIIGQENRLLANYCLQSLPRGLRPKIALWGHGRNFQARHPRGLAEQWKRLWAKRCDWWFCYTEETRRHILSLGFPEQRTTVFNNAVDTSALARLAAGITAPDLEAKRQELGLAGRNVGLFVGGLYPDKRLAFLIAAADVVRAAIPDFELVVVGDGPQSSEFARLSASRPWVKATGAAFGADKVRLMKLGKIFLMPGLVGLAVLDAGALGLPVVTTAFPYHSPEISYLRESGGGMIVASWQDPEAYGRTVADLLLDPEHLQRLSDAARTMAQRYTVERMVQRFSDGVCDALQA